MSGHDVGQGAAIGRDDERFVMVRWEIQRAIRDVDVWHRRIPYKDGWEYLAVLPDGTSRKAEINGHELTSAIEIFGAAVQRMINELLVPPIPGVTTPGHGPDCKCEEHR